MLRRRRAGWSARGENNTFPRLPQATVIANRHAHIMVFYQCSQGADGKLVHCELALLDAFDFYKSSHIKG